MFTSASSCSGGQGCVYFWNPSSLFVWFFFQKKFLTSFNVISALYYFAALSAGLAPPEHCSKTQYTLLFFDGFFPHILFPVFMTVFDVSFSFESLRIHCLKAQDICKAATDAVNFKTLYLIICKWFYFNVFFVEIFCFKFPCVAVLHFRKVLGWFCKVGGSFSQSRSLIFQKSKPIIDQNQEGSWFFARTKPTFS